MSKRRLYLICLLFTLPLALVVTEIRQYSRNTLSENGRWVSAKPFMQIGLVGAHHFLFTRNALARNRLDMGAWHAYNEIYFDTPLRLGSLELSFRLDDQAHLSVIFARTTDSFLGARFSRHPKFPSTLLRGKRSGRFADKAPIEGIDLDDAWHRARIEARDGLWLVSLDGVTVARLDGDDVPQGLIGFRNGFSRVEIDNVRVIDADGRLLLDESFRHRRGYWQTLLVNLGLVYIVLLLVAWLASRTSRGGDPRAAHWVALVTLVATLMALLLLGFDMHVWSRSYFYRSGPQPWGAPPASLVRLESRRQALLGIESGQRIEPSVNTVARSLTRWDLSTPFAWPGPHAWHRFVAYTSNAPGEPRFFARERLRALDPEARAIRVAFIGSSQTVGAGAEHVNQALVSRIHRSLSDSLDGELQNAKLDLNIFNLAVQSSEAPLLLLTFERHWIELAPDLVIINLSYNDRDLPLFESSLERFVELGRSRGIETLFVVEALAADREDPAVRQKQRAMREAGRSLGVPVLDLDAYMAAPSVRDSGFLWWDPVHLTSYGQSLAAAWLAERIQPHLRALLAGRVSAVQQSGSLVR